MTQTAQQLREIIAHTFPLLEALSENALTAKPAPDKWSKKEILGHLIDSANNNQQKFVRMMRQAHLDFVGYEQNHWVAAQQYQSADWSKMLHFWKFINLHLAHLIENVAITDLKNTISINGEGPFSLEFIMKDYNEHLKHHLHQLLPEANISSAFVNVYHNQ
jgi:hypothetical protein